MSFPFVNRAAWIWSAEGTHAAPPPEASTPSHYQVRLFRRRFTPPLDRAVRLEVHVSADSRYVFFCNGALVGRGPAKGDVHHHFYETFDLTSLVVAGENVLAALVLDMSRVAHRPALLGAPCSVMTYAGGFVLDGALAAAGDGGAIEELSTGVGDGWKVMVDQAHRFQNEGTTFEGYHGYFEHRVGRLIPWGWTRPGFHDNDWPAATVLYKAERLENRRDPASPYGLMPRMISLLIDDDTPHRFTRMFAPGGGAAPGEEIPDGIKLTVDANRTIEVIMDVGGPTAGYPLLAIEGGGGSRVRVTYAEALRLPWGTPGATLLGRQQSLANLASHFADESTGWTFDERGTLSGWSDIWEPAGAGTSEEAETFQPLHWRSFRFIKLSITTGAQRMVAHVSYRTTAYPFPLASGTGFQCSDKSLEQIWVAALTTAKLCSHETFEDCPHYEQMQYAGDTMITSKIAMLAFGDYALTRQAIYHFDWSRLPDGLTQSRYPSRLLQVIPSWSLHWITNVRDYVYCSGDLATARDVIHGVRAVLDWFRRHGDADGLPAKLPYWNITDWCPWWPRGVVPGADAGPTCIISAQYIEALEEAADLCGLLGDRRPAVEFRREAAQLRRKVHARFWSEEEGLYFDRPGGPEISQYGNAWAILCGAAGKGQRRRMLARFPHDPKLAPGSFFWWHAGFRALEQCGAYDRMPECLGPWHESIDYGLATFVEENSYWRSLCHAWSAHPAIEFMTRVLGVTPTAPGFAGIEVAPHRCGLSYASGQVCTPRGLVEVAWRLTAGGKRFAIEVETPADTAVRVRLPGGDRRELRGGKFAAEVALA